jgi:osmotically-inducible protein OsmY
MSGLIKDNRWELSPAVRAAAKTELPLRLPRPEETGLRGRRIDSGAARENSSIRLRTRNGEPLSDVELEARAQRALLQSGVRGFTRLHAEVRDGVATLYGRLPTDFERDLAVQLVRRVNGLAGVNHEIAILSTRPVSTRRTPSRRNRLVLLFAVIGLIVSVGACVGNWPASRHAHVEVAAKPVPGSK